MTRNIFKTLLFTLFAVMTGFASAKVVNITEPPFSAVGDGITDNRIALSKALGSLESGDTILIPAGRFKIVLTGQNIHVPAGVTILGESEKSILSLDSSEDKYRAFSSLNNDVTVEGITIERGADFPLVMFPIFNERCNITFRNCIIDGNRSIYPDKYCHIFQVGHGKLSNLLLQRIVLRDASYGLFQDNKASGIVDSVTVEQCLFEKNTSSDLEFNSPNGTMTNVIVRNCLFRDNLCKSPSAGFAVGFANVKDSKVENCDIRGYGSEALHVEDRSTNILLTGNTITGGSLIQGNGVIMVLSDSTDVTIANNLVDGRSNTNKTHLILVTAGGNRFRCPSEVSVNSNILVNGELTRTWYLQPGSGPDPVDNIERSEEHENR